MRGARPVFGACHDQNLIINNQALQALNDSVIYFIEGGQLYVQ